MEAQALFRKMGLAKRNLTQKMESIRLIERMIQELASEHKSREQVQPDY
jgi:hypothetical protein